MIYVLEDGQVFCTAAICFAGSLFDFHAYSFRIWSSAESGDVICPTTRGRKMIRWVVMGVAYVLFLVLCNVVINSLTGFLAVSLGLHGIADDYLFFFGVGCSFVAAYLTVKKLSTWRKVDDDVT